MYTKASYSLFIKNTVFFKNGKAIADRGEDGKIILRPDTTCGPVIMTRSQAYRYWSKHFPTLPYYMLPKPMSDAVMIDPRDERDLAVFINPRNGLVELCYR